MEFIAERSEDGQWQCTQSLCAVQSYERACGSLLADKTIITPVLIGFQRQDLRLGLSGVLGALFILAQDELDHRVEFSLIGSAELGNWRLGAVLDHDAFVTIFSCTRTVVIIIIIFISLS